MLSCSPYLLPHLWQALILPWFCERFLPMWGRESDNDGHCHLFIGTLLCFYFYLLAIILDFSLGSLFILPLTHKWLQDPIDSVSKEVLPYFSTPFLTSLIWVNIISLSEFCTNFLFGLLLFHSTIGSVLKQKCPKTESLAFWGRGAPPFPASSSLFQSHQHSTFWTKLKLRRRRLIDPPPSA